MRKFCLSALVVCVAWGAASTVAAQQRIGYFDSDRVLERMPEYQTMQQELSRIVTQRRQEVDEAHGEVEVLQTEFAARELLFTDDERAGQLETIRAAEQEAEALRRRYFGAEGEIFQEQQQRLQPIQARVIEAVTAVAERRNFDYIFDRSGDYVFLYAKSDFDITEDVLDELDIGVGAEVTGVPSRTEPAESGVEPAGEPAREPVREPAEEPTRPDEPKPGID